MESGRPNMNSRQNPLIRANSRPAQSSQNTIVCQSYFLENSKNFLQNLVHYEKKCFQTRALYKMRECAMLETKRNSFTGNVLLANNGDNLTIIFFRHFWKIFWTRRFFEIWRILYETYLYSVKIYMKPGDNLWNVNFWTLWTSVDHDLEIVEFG